MSSLNKVLLIGNLGKDPELKMTPGGQPMARFSVATTEAWKDKDGNKQSKTEWHNVVVWGKQAEIAEKYLRKGKQVYIEGRVQYREYTDQAGVKKYITDIRCDQFQMLGRLEESGGSGGSRESYGNRDNYGSRNSGMDYEESAPSAPATAGGYEDDIPF